jgi:hypothetical protein
VRRFGASLDSCRRQGRLRAITSRTMPYLAGKPKEDSSMALKRGSQKVCKVVRPASPVRMVKLFVEPKFHAA